MEKNYLVNNDRVICKLCRDEYYNHATPLEESELEQELAIMGHSDLPCEECGAIGDEA